MNIKEFSERCKQRNEETLVVQFSPKTQMAYSTVFDKVPDMLAAAIALAAATIVQSSNGNLTEEQAINGRNSSYNNLMA